MEIIRSSSIEYEAHLTHGSETSGPTEYSKNMARRRAKQSDIQVLASFGSNSATNQVASSSQASFFKLNGAEGSNTARGKHEQRSGQEHPSNDAKYQCYDLHDSLEGSNENTQISHVAPGKLP